METTLNMTILQKLIFSVIVALGLVIFLRMNSQNMKRYNRSVSENNPRLHKMLPFMFSEKKNRIIEYIFLGFGIIWLIMIWTNNANFLIE